MYIKYSLSDINNIKYVLCDIIYAKYVSCNIIYIKYVFCKIIYIYLLCNIIYIEYVFCKIIYIKYVLLNIIYTKHVLNNCNLKYIINVIQLTGNYVAWMPGTISIFILLFHTSQFQLKVWPFCLFDVWQIIFTTNTGSYQQWEGKKRCYGGSKGMRQANFSPPRPWMQ